MDIMEELKKHVKAEIFEAQKILSSNQLLIDSINMLDATDVNDHFEYIAEGIELLIDQIDDLKLDNNLKSQISEDRGGGERNIENGRQRSGLTISRLKVDSIKMIKGDQNAINSGK